VAKLAVAFNAGLAPTVGVMSRVRQSSREVFAQVRESLAVPPRRQIGLGHLLLASAFAAVAAVSSAAAIILGLPGLDPSPTRVETSVRGAVHLDPPPRPAH